MRMRDYKTSGQSFYKISGQSLSELAMLFALIVAVMVGMHLYIKRSLQARYKGGVDYVFSKIIEQQDLTYNQYQPYYLQRQTFEAAQGEQQRGFPQRSIRNETTDSFRWETTDSIEYGLEDRDRP